MSCADDHNIHKNITKMPTYSFFVISFLYFAKVIQLMGNSLMYGMLSSQNKTATTTTPTTK